jgi:hypothetical protein
MDALRKRVAEAERLAADRGSTAERLQRALDEGGQAEDGQGGAAAARAAAAAAAVTAAEALRRIGTVEEVRHCSGFNKAQGCCTLTGLLPKCCTRCC